MHLFYDDESWTTICWNALFPGRAIAILVFPVSRYRYSRFSCVALSLFALFPYRTIAIRTIQSAIALFALLLTIPDHLPPSCYFSFKLFLAYSLFCHCQKHLRYGNQLHILVYQRMDKSSYFKGKLWEYGFRLSSPAALMLNWSLQVPEAKPPLLHHSAGAVHQADQHGWIPGGQGPL